MDSPVRIQLKKNDYLRHKFFRTLNRRKKRLLLQLIEAPEKELRRRLRLKRYEGGKSPMDYEYRGTVYDDELKNQGITHVAELPEVIVKGRDYTKPYESSFEYDPNFAKELPYFLPVVGDALGVADVAKDVYNGNYLNAAIGTGLLLVPNAIEKPAKLIRRFPGYMLRSLIEGNPLEKQLSKTGTISTNSIRAQIAKASAMEKDVVEKVLSSVKFADQKAIDYNQFRLAVQDELITYTRKPQTKYSDYGIDRLGYKSDRHIWDMQQDPNIRIENGLPVHANTGIPLTQEERAAWLNQGLPELNTFTFESSRIPIGNAKHYDNTTLGHSRTYTTSEEPDVLHVMESQSDWAQGYKSKSLNAGDAELSVLDEYVRRYNERRPLEGNSTPTTIEDVYNAGTALGLSREQVDIALGNKAFAPSHQEDYLRNNYLQRQLQENLKYAAERGQTKMRYPTPDTAAKIEGYKKHQKFEFKPEFEDVEKEFESKAYAEMGVNPEDYSTSYPEEVAEILELEPDNKILLSKMFEGTGIENPSENLITLLNKMRGLYSGSFDYLPLHKTILKKYADFPKQFKKLWKDQDVKTITDKKGNSWYEVNVPENFLNREWIYGILPFAIGGAAAATQDYNRGKDSGIHIKPENRGKFNALKKRTGKTTEELTHSKNPLTRKRAIFALNARKWNHKK